MRMVSIIKNGRRYDMPVPLAKGDAIAVDEPVISEGAIVTLGNHKGKVLKVEGEKATVSWEDASMSEVPVGSLAYSGRVEKSFGFPPKKEPPKDATGGAQAGEQFPRKQTANPQQPTQKPEGGFQAKAPAPQGKPMQQNSEARPFQEQKPVSEDKPNPQDQQGAKPSFPPKQGEEVGKQPNQAQDAKTGKPPMSAQQQVGQGSQGAQGTQGQKPAIPQFGAQKTPQFGGQDKAQAGQQPPAIGAKPDNPANVPQKGGMNPQQPQQPQGQSFDASGSPISQQGQMGGVGPDGMPIQGQEMGTVVGGVSVHDMGDRTEVHSHVYPGLKVTIFHSHTSPDGSQGGAVLAVRNVEGNMTAEEAMEFSAMLQQAAKVGMSRNVVSRSMPPQVTPPPPPPVGRDFSAAIGEPKEG